MNNVSIRRRLILGLAAVGLVGAIVLLLFVGIEYGLSPRNGLDRTTFTSILDEVGDHVVLPLLVLLIPMATAILWVIRQSLSPLKQAAARIESAQSADRGARIDTSDLPAEAVGFADAVNGLLERIDAAAARHEDFAADVAHELRTPLTILALELEKLPGDVAPRLQKDVKAMSRLVDQLLVLAQLDAQTAARAPLKLASLDDIAMQTVSQLAPLAIEEGKELVLDRRGAGAVMGHPEAITAALRNLVENALRVTPRGGSVVVTTGPEAVIRVRDGGQGLSDDALDLMRQRLRRGDAASHTGAGLGLAIVSRIMDFHGGVLRTDPSRSELMLEFNQVPQPKESRL